MGLQTGIERNLWKNRLILQADYISGKHSVSNSVIGLAYAINQRWIVSGGYQRNPYQHTNAAIFELTYIPRK